MAEGAEEAPVIYLHEIKRQYRQGEATLTILDGAKLALWAGQSVALVAPSGSGKSTLLHIAGLLESPDDGEVYVGGAPTSQLSDIDRTQIRRSDIGFVYQSHRLLPEFTALENVMLPQMIRGLKRAETIKRSRGDPVLSRSWRAHDAPARGTVRRRAATRRHRARGGQCAARAAGGRADRKPRPEYRRSRLQGVDAAREGDAGRDADRHPQHGPCRPDGPPRVTGRWQGGRAGLNPVARRRSPPATLESLYAIDLRAGFPPVPLARAQPARSGASTSR